MTKKQKEEILSRMNNVKLADLSVLTEEYIEDEKFMLSLCKWNKFAAIYAVDLVQTNPSFFGELVKLDFDFAMWIYNKSTKNPDVINKLKDITKNVTNFTNLPNELLQDEKFVSYCKEIISFELAQEDVRLKRMVDDLVDQKIALSKRELKLKEEKVEIKNTEHFANDYDRVTKMFFEMKLPKNLLGYQYTRTAILLLLEDPDLIHQMTKGLQPAIAKKHNSSVTKVERAIRNLIEVQAQSKNWKATNARLGIELFGQEKNPTVGQFLSTFAETVAFEKSSALKESTFKRD